MNYIEHIYVCLAAPILVAVFYLKARDRKMAIFLLSGMTVCLLSSYISTFIAYASGADTFTASLTIAPFVEETMKLMPLLFYLLVFEPDKRDVLGGVVMTAIGFANFENVCYMTQNGTAQLLHLLIRGFGTGAMHVVCGAIIGFGIRALWERIWLQIAGTAGLLALAVTLHGIYNLLVAQTGTVALIGYLIPIAVSMAGIAARWRQALRRRNL